MALVQKQFSDLITFTRSSAGGRFNERGLFEMVPANQPRFDYDPVTRELRGLLIEESRTNYILNSGDISLFARNVGATTKPSAELAPDGTTAATEVIMSGNTGSGVYRANSQTSSPGTFSLYVKPLTGNGVLRLTMEGSAYSGLQAGSVLFDLVHETFSPAGPAGEVRGGIHKLSDGWFRIYMSRSVSNGTGATNVTFYAGDLETKSFAAWGAQLEGRTSPTSYIPTVASQVTRTADIVSIRELSPWYNTTEGTVYVDYAPGAIGLGSTCAGFYMSSENPALDIVTIRNGITQGTITGILVNSTGGRLDMVGATGIPIGTRVKGAIAFRSGDGAIAVNGGKAIVTTPTGIPLPNRFDIGRATSAQQYANGHVREIRYYPRRLTDAELEVMTK